MKHELYYYEGCRDCEYKIDRENAFNLKDNIIHPLAKSLLKDYIDKCENITYLQNLFMVMMTDVGKYNNLGQCPVCGDYESEYNLTVDE